MTDLISPPAAVVGGSIVSFASGLPASHREDVYMCTAFAQMATRAAEADGLSGDWFAFYCNQLRFLGWDVPKPQTFNPAPSTSMGSKATERIRSALGEKFALPISRALADLEHNASALSLFESTSLSADVGHFQMIPCVMNGAHKVDMAIYNRKFSMLKKISRFLFVKNASLEEGGNEQLTMITFNTLYYAQFREKVKRSVLSQSVKYLSELEI